MTKEWMFWADYRRYKKEIGNVFYEPSIIIVFLFRLRSTLYKKKSLRFIRIFLMILIEPFYFFLTLLFGIHIPKNCKIGGGLIIHHFGGIVLNPYAVIGDNCTLRQNVTIGNRKKADDVPILGNNVNIGVGAVIIGKIHIGNNAKIGANSVVLTDVPKNCTAVGVPAKILKK